MAELERAADAERLRRLAQAGVLSPEAYARACELAHLPPPGRARMRSLARWIGTAHWAAAVLLAASAASSGGRLSRSLSFGVAFALAAALAFRGARQHAAIAPGAASGGRSTAPARREPGQLASLTAIALAGPLIHAAFGLSGWPLWLAWAAATLPFARRSPALALGWLLLIDAALWQAVPETGWRLVGLGLVHGAIWAGFEVRAPALRPLARLCCAAALMPLAASSWLALLGQTPTGANEALALLFAGAVGAGLTHRRRFDPILVGIAAAAVLTAITARVGHGLLQPITPSENNLYLALGLLLEAGAIGALLIRVNRTRTA